VASSSLSAEDSARASTFCPWGKISCFISLCRRDFREKSLFGEGIRTLSRYTCSLRYLTRLGYSANITCRMNATVFSGRDVGSASDMPLSAGLSTSDFWFWCCLVDLLTWNCRSGSRAE
jgi:hypothetical protein